MCSRCTGLAMGAIIGYFFKIGDITTNYFYLLILTIFFALPGLIDSLTQYFDKRESNNKFRFITGSFGGLGVVTLARIFQIFIS